jgi:dTDP-4-dehydrorhamnose reductase
MKLLILGAGGMVGHMLSAYFRANTRHTVFSTSRDPRDKTSLFLDVMNEYQVQHALELVRADAVINCIGLLPEKASGEQSEALEVNGLLPHRLRLIVERNGGKLIQVSTGCVFSGKRDGYTEHDLPDGGSVYAITKAMGEVRGERHLTLRTALIGPEIRPEARGLFARFLKQSGEVGGRTKWIGNGITTLQLAKTLHLMLEQEVTGVYHLAAPERISEYDLLLLIQRIFHVKHASVIPVETDGRNGILKNTRTDFADIVPGYQQMLYELRTWMRSA